MSVNKCYGFKNKLGTIILSLMPKFTGVTSGNVASFNADGELTDSGKAAADIKPVTNNIEANNSSPLTSNAVYRAIYLNKPVLPFTVNADGDTVSWDIEGEEEEAMWHITEWAPIANQPYLCIVNVSFDNAGTRIVTYCKPAILVWHDTVYRNSSNEITKIERNVRLTIENIIFYTYIKREGTAPNDIYTAGPVDVYKFPTMDELIDIEDYYGYGAASSWNSNPNIHGHGEDTSAINDPIDPGDLTNPIVDLDPNEMK